MKTFFLKYIFIFIAGLLITNQLAASCFHMDDLILPELLNDLQSELNIIHIEVDTIFGNNNAAIGTGGFAKVIKAFRGENITNRIRLISHSGTTQGGRRLKIGQQYIVVALTKDGYNFTAFICDPFSFEIDKGTTYKSGRNEYTSQEKRFEMIQHYFNLKNKKHSGQVQLKLGDFLYGKGDFKNGIPIGQWKYFRQSPVNDSIILKSIIFYKNGLPDGKLVYYDRYFGKPQKIEFHSNGELIKEEFYQPIDNEYNTIKAKEIYYYKKDGQRFKRTKYIDFESGHLIDLNHKIFPFKITNQVRHGKIITYYKNKSVAETGQYYHGAMIGNWINYDSLGNKTEEKNIPFPDTTIANFVRFSKEGQPLLFGNLKNGKQNGKWILQNPETFHRTYNFKDGKIDGILIKFSSDGNRIYAKEYYKNNLKHGESFDFFIDGNIQSKTYFKKGKKEGTEITYLQDGSIYSKGIYENDFKHNIFKIYKNGKTYKINYNKGLKHGTFKEPNYKNGEDEGEYYLGFKKGLWKYFDKKDLLIREEFYDFEFSMETPVWYKYYNPDGSLKEKIDYRDF